MRSFLEGGVTRDQFTSLYKNLAKEQRDEQDFQAAIHGIDVSKGREAQQQTEAPTKDTFVFGDPASYDSMSASEKEALTGQMMNGHKNWVAEKAKHG